MKYLSIVDLILFPVLLFIIVNIARNIKARNIDRKPEYSYFVLGLLVKIAGGIGLCLIYTLYYDGGDTTVYFFDGAVPLKNLFLKSPSDYFYVMTHENTIEGYMLFDGSTGWPQYWKDSQAFFVIRFINPIAMFTFNSYIAATMILSCLCYTGIWRLFLVFCDVFPRFKREFAISILFVPSVVFWGSGILKDSISLAAIGWFVFAFYYGIIKRKNFYWNLVLLFVAAYLILSVKPYILYALIPGALVWLTGSITDRIESPFFRRLTVPLMITISIFSGYFILSSLGEQLGKFSIDTLLERAVIVQQDLKKDYYGGNSFDIGDFDPTPVGIMKKFPIAVSSGLFRPFLWEVQNPVMLVSALENTYILFLTINLLATIPIRRMVKIIGSNQLVVFSLLFAVFFSFSVGLTTSNFGSLVRYRIPAFPFLLSVLYIIKNTNKNILAGEPLESITETQSTPSYIHPELTA